MAVVENSGIGRIASSTQLDVIGGTQTHVIAGDHLHHQHQSPKTITLNHQSPSTLRLTKPQAPTDQSFQTNLVVEQQNHKIISAQQDTDGEQPQKRIEDNHHRNINGVDARRNGGIDKVFVSGGGEGFEKETRNLEEMLSKLNPMAEEFVPPSLVTTNHHWLLPPAAGHFGYSAGSFLLPTNASIPDGRRPRKSGNNQVRTEDGKYGAGRRFKRMYSRTSMAQREDVIRRTVYVSEIDHQVTEEQLAALFLHCGQVVDCRVCGDPNSILRFAFVEFTDEEGATNALSLSGTMLGYYPVRVLPSKTAIAPVNPTFLPQSEEEREMCARTIYCTNIDKKIAHSELKLFFESMCGEVYRLRMLGDNHHSTRIAFVEFVMAESAIAALNCSGAILGSLPIRVSPSKTPVRPRPVRASVH